MSLLRARLAPLLKRGGMFGAAVSVGLATAVGQLIGFLLLPIVSRRFDAEAFALFGLFFNFVTTAGVIAPLGLHEAALAPPRRREALALFGMATLAVTILSAILGMISAVLIHEHQLGLGVLPTWSAILVGASIWFIGLSMVLQIWTIRARNFSTLAVSTLSQATTRGGLQVAFGLLASSWGWLGLAVADIGSRAVNVATLASRCQRDIVVGLRSIPRRGWATVKAYKQFPLLRTPSHVANNLAFALPLFLMASRFPASDVGAFSFMMTVVVAPVALFQRAIGDVFLGEFAARFRSDPVAARKLLLRTLSLLFVLALFVVVVLVTASPALFSIVFGSHWRLAGEMAVVYAPVMLGNLVVAPLGGVLTVANRPGYKLAVDLLSIGAQFAAFALAVGLGLSATSTAATVFAGCALAFLLYLGLVLFAAYRPNTKGREIRAGGGVPDPEVDR